jgi:PII-like signaling protein
MLSFVKTAIEELKPRYMRGYGENDRWKGKPLYDEIVKGLRAHDIAGVTVYRGILGYGANRRIHKDERFSHDRPILIPQSIPKRS